MRKSLAAVGSVVFFLAAPACVAGAIPYWLSGWRVEQPLHHFWPLRIGGAALLVAGAAVLVHAFVRFVSEGSGTPAPIAPTEQLVIGGVYRYVRNPMYVAVVAVIVGQALVLWQARLLPYAGLALALMVAFVRFHEEPVLLRKYGAAYDRYRHGVPGWWPRLRPWKNTDDRAQG
jgi:protein-S-isoprenylcysteine O-methyltransferase Ste14